MEPGTRVDPTEAQPHEHGALCHIVPPYLLQRLAQHPDPAVQACARATLAADAALREAGRQPPSVAGSPRTSVTVAAPAPDRTISDARHERQLPGERVRAEGDPAVADEAVNQAYDGLGHTWALLLEEFGRDSLDGAGMPLHATVHYGRDYANAFWDGERMVFGDGDGEVFTGFTGAVDVIGHELAHGVTELTAGLVYRGQPGALNESVSDVLGSLVKQRLAGQTAEEADWLIGAGLFTSAVQGEALRSLRAPGTAYDDDVLGRDPQPATMADYVDTSDDNGGVHINSGIPNHAFYLAATAIGGHAWERAGQVWFDVLTGGTLARDADFVAFAEATVATAAARFGEGAPETDAITGAWRQVGVLDVAPADGPVPPAGADTGPDAEPPPAETPVYLCRTGGFAGVTRESRFRPAELPDPDAERWTMLLVSDALMQLAREEPAPDRFVYRVVAEQRHVDVTIAEQAVSDDVRDLFDRTLRLT